VRRRCNSVVLALGLVIAACGGAAREESGGSKSPAAAPYSPAQSPPGGAPAGAASSPSAGYPALSPPASPAAPPPAAADASASSTTGKEGDESGRTAALGRARSDLDAAERELQTSAGDCANACRALGSMERATGHLCELASSLEDRRRCEEAKTKVLAARDRVRGTCGACPGGPSLERSAPIPSSR
jgi:hypothetical protein